MNHILFWERERKILIDVAHWHEIGLTALFLCLVSLSSEFERTLIRRRLGTGRVRSYIALVRQDFDHDYLVSFIDFPRCTATGRTLIEAAAHAEDALALYAGGMIQGRWPLPEPTPFEAVTRGNAVCVIRVPLYAERSRI